MPDGRRSLSPRSISISNPDKVLFPDEGITKQEVVEYYAAVAPRILPHVRGRALTLERFPDGIHEHRFFTKGVPRHFPDWIPTVVLPKRGGRVEHVVCDNASTLRYLANQAAVTLHVALGKAAAHDRADTLVFDLDPSREDLRALTTLAARLRALLEDLGLHVYLKTSGSRGLHLTIPIRPAEPWPVVRRFARDLATLVAARYPEEVTVEHSKAARRDRIFLDWMRNTYAQTVVAPFSLRARPGAPAAVTLAWEEIDDPAWSPRGWPLAEARERAAGAFDPWSGWRSRARSLGPAVEALRRLQSAA